MNCIAFGLEYSLECESVCAQMFLWCSTEPSCCVGCLAAIMRRSFLFKWFQRCLLENKLCLAKSAWITGVTLTRLSHQLKERFCSSPSFLLTFLSFFFLFISGNKSYNCFSGTWTERDIRKHSPFNISAVHIFCKRALDISLCTTVRTTVTALFSSVFLSVALAIAAPLSDLASLLCPFLLLSPEPLSMAHPLLVELGEAYRTDHMFLPCSGSLDANLIQKTCEWQPDRWISCNRLAFGSAWIFHKR